MIPITTVQKIIKRDGSIVDFDFKKIISAIDKANNEVKNKDISKGIGGDILFDVYNEIAKNCNSVSSIPSVEQIQDFVEKALVDARAYDVAKAYMLYRYTHDLVRTEYSNLMQELRKKLSAEDVQNQNANVDEHSFGGRIGEANDIVMKHIAIKYRLSDMARNNHLNNEIYIHDLSHYEIGDHNCLSVPLDDLLKNGFNTRQTDVRPAQSVNTAFQLVAVLFQLQSLNQFGGVSATHLDWTMIPYVQKSFRKHWNDGVTYILQDKSEIEVEWQKVENDFPISKYPNHNEYVRIFNYAFDMTVKEIYQAVEGLFHNLKIWA